MVYCQKNTEHAIENGLRKYSKNCGHCAKIVQTKYDGKIIAVYDSIHEASRQTNISKGNITSVCKGNRISAGGYKWKYHDESKLELEKEKFNVKIWQLDTNANRIKKWNDMNLASENLDIELDHILRVCNGRNSMAGGFKWKYAK